MEPRSGGSADTSHLVKQIAFVEIHAETFQNMHKLILETNLLMVFGLIPDITLDSFYMRMRIGKRAVTALPGFSSIQTHYVLEPPLCGFAIFAGGVRPRAATADAAFARGYVPFFCGGFHG